MIIQFEKDREAQNISIAYMIVVCLLMHKGLKNFIFSNLYKQDTCRFNCYTHFKRYVKFKHYVVYTLRCINATLYKHYVVYTLQCINAALFKLYVVYKLRCTHTTLYKHYVV